MASLADEFLLDCESDQSDNDPDLFDADILNKDFDGTTKIDPDKIILDDDITNKSSIANFFTKVKTDQEPEPKYKRKLYEPAPEQSNFNDDDEDDDLANSALLAKIRSVAEARQRKRKIEGENMGIDIDGVKVRKLDKKIASSDEDESENDDMGMSVDEIEYKKLQKRLHDEAENKKFEKLKAANQSLNNPLTPAVKVVEPGKTCFRPLEDTSPEAYLVYKIRQEKKKVQFILPEKQKSVWDYASLKLSPHYNNILNKLDTTKLSEEGADEETYKLIIEANALLSEIDFEFIKVYNFVRDVYTARFPELETLITNKVEYLRAAGLLLNDLLNAKAVLTDKISDAQVMIVAMTGSNTTGKKLSGEKIDQVKEACQLAEDLTKDRESIVKFVQSRMSLLAPNVTAIIGPNVAAQLIGCAADGLQGLSRMPGCNVYLLGQEKGTQFSAQAKLPHTGFVYYSPLVQSIEPDLRRKAARMVANKVALAARADARLTPSERRGEPYVGLGMRDKIYDKFEKWEEPAKVKGVKALPKPLEHAGKKRRGGRRYRKMKERLGMTEVRKQANRITFGEIEEDLNQEDLGISLGHLNNTQGSGVIRNLVEEKKSKVRQTKKMKQILAKEAAMNGARTTISSGLRTVHKELHGGRTTVLGWGGTITSMGRRSTFSKTGGFASSVTFTPVQGLEVINPELNAHNDEFEDGMQSTASYFGDNVFKTPIVPNL